MDAGERWDRSSRPAEAATAGDSRGGRRLPGNAPVWFTSLMSAAWERAIDKATGEDGKDHDFIQIQFTQISLFEMEAGLLTLSSADVEGPGVPVRRAVLGTTGRPIPTLASVHQMLVTMSKPVLRRCQHPLKVVDGDKHWMRAQRWGSQVCGVPTSTGWPLLTSANLWTLNASTNFSGCTSPRPWTDLPYLHFGLAHIFIGKTGIEY